LKVSIVTPCYQGDEFLEETIQSVLKQDYDNLEYWVIDGGSTDNSADIAGRFAGDPRFHWISEPDEGQSDAINKGLIQSSGEIFNWINADDLLLPDALRAVVKTFEKTHADLVTGRTLEFCNEGQAAENMIELPVRRTAEQTICRGIFCQPSTFWKTAILRELGGVEQQLHYAMDWHLWVKYLVLHGQCRVFRSPEIWAKFRRHANSKTVSASTGFHGEVLAIYRKLFDDLGVKGVIPFSDIELGGVPASVALPDFVFGPDFSKARFMGCYCDRVTKRLYNAKRYDEARKWLSLGKGSFRSPTFGRMKMAFRLMLK
jgi:glycosyltransferase involved in cell wall biosynthesis